MTPELVRPPADAPVRAAFSGRAGGVSRGPYAGLNLGASVGDRPADVRENRRRLCAALGLDEERVSLGRQVHGALVREVLAPPRPGRFTGALTGWPEGDGLTTRVPGLPLVVLGADCLPVLLWRRDRPAVGAAHAGWRGLVAGVLESAVRALGDPSRTAAAIGPGVGPCCYPTGAEVRESFARRFGDRVVRGAAVDLAAASRAALRAAGVPDGAIWTLAACTSCERGRFYSYRRDGSATGRQAGVIWIEGGIGHR